MDSAGEFLTRRINYERTTTVPYQSGEFKLDRMRRLLSLLGDPHLAVKAVHIAGTKGKGSTAAMIAAILEAAGYHTGLYTSPHLERIEERIAIDGQICPPEAFLQLAAQVQPVAEQLDREAAAIPGASGPTFFEVTTAMAFLRFAQAKVDAAVLEVGLGGRVDSTNVCLPEVSVITTISFDHMKQLGNTLEAIASEKAGIIKPSVPIVSGVLSPAPRDVIALRAAETGAPLFQRGRDYDFDQPTGSVPEPPGEQLTFREMGYTLTDVTIPLLGRHQAANAATAIAAAIRLRERGWQITDKQLRSGLGVARCPARIERVASDPATILDVAHNPASIEATVAALRERFSARRRIAIFASSKDKDYAAMLRLVLGAFDAVILTQYLHNPRAMEVEQLLTIALALRSESNDRSEPALHATVRPVDAWRLARALASADDLICITGSFFLAAEMGELVRQACQTA